MSQPKCLIILGMHRSGTSATTGILRCLGVNLGTKLYSGHAEINAKGYFENSDIADTNEEALLTMNSAWDDILLRPDNWWRLTALNHYQNKIQNYLQRDFSETSFWAIKDPRICRLLPWWLDILTTNNIQANFIFVIRPPYEVFRSLHKRDGFSQEKSYLLWILHYLDAEYWTRGLPRFFTTFEELATDPVSTFTRVEKNLNIEFPISISTASNELSKFIDKDLIHHSNSTLEVEEQSKLHKLANQLYNNLCLIVKNPEAEIDFNELDSIRSQVELMQQSFTPLLVEQLRDIYESRSKLQLTMNKIIRSWSWPIGKPIRFMERLFKRDV